MGKPRYHFTRKQLEDAAAGHVALWLHRTRLWAVLVAWWHYRRMKPAELAAELRAANLEGAA